MEPYQLTLTQATQQIQDGTLTPTKLAESLLKRIEKHEPTLQAWVTINPEQVIQDAEKATKKIQNKTIKSPLHGIPVGIKDIFYTKGIRTTMGSPLYANYIPKIDAKIVTTLKQAGAIILGKTETTEFAVHDPAPTRNPWNTQHTPGGSSSGSAAAVSSGMCPLAFGSQTGGSIIRPASYCGLVGLKPTYNLLPRNGVFPLSWSLDHVGFMTRTVNDTALTLSTLIGKKINLRPLDEPPRIGLLAGYFKENAHDQVWLGFEQAIGKLWGEGAEIIDITLPDTFKIVHDVHRVIMSVETAAAHEDDFRSRRDQYREYLQGFISSGLIVPATAYLRAQRIRKKIINDMLKLLKTNPILVCPSSVDPAPKGLAWTGSPAFNAPWSLTGLPSITVPSGLTEDRLPLGFQIIGKHYNETQLMNVAAWCEEQFKFPQLPIDPVTL